MKPRTASVIAALLSLVGCRTTVVTVTKPDGTVIRAENYTVGNDAALGELAFETPNAKGSVKGFDSKATGLQTIDKLVDRIPAP